jgi:hypothetical protein
MKLKTVDPLTRTTEINVSKKYNIRPILSIMNSQTFLMADDNVVILLLTNCMIM